MTRLSVVACAVAVAMGVGALAQTVKPVPRPPARTGPPTPEEGSAAPDGYSPIPEWLGQTRAPRPSTSAAFDVQTYASGLSGAFSMAFLPDGRIMVGERPGRIRIVAKRRHGVSPDRGPAVEPVGEGAGPVRGAAGPRVRDQSRRATSATPSSPTVRIPTRRHAARASFWWPARNSRPTTGASTM